MWAITKVQNYRMFWGLPMLVLHLPITCTFSPVSCISSAGLLTAINNLCTFETSPLKCNMCNEEKIKINVLTIAQKIEIIVNCY